MSRRGFARLLVLTLLAGLLLTVPAARAADLQREEKALEIENLFGELLGSNQATPVFTDYGNGLYSLSVTLEPETRERLLKTLQVGDDKATTFFVLAAGMQLTTPSNPSTLIHAALSNPGLSYNHWLIVLNLGTQNVTRNTTLKLTGPGRKFTRSGAATYGAGGIWAVWHNPGAGVGQPGVYKLQGTVAGAGSVTTQSFAVFP